MSESVSMTELVGREFDFYGVDAGRFCLDHVVYEAIEDPEDGYRSSLDEVVAHGKQAAGLGTFFVLPLARVRIEVASTYREFGFEYDDFRGWKLVDVEDGHVWLQFGTEDWDDYYPMFSFRYYAKSPIVEVTA